MSLNLPDPVALDANCFIYILESPQSRRGSAIISDLRSAPAKTRFTSTLTISELLTRPFAEHGRDYAVGLLERFLGLPGINVIPVDAEVAIFAAELRAQTRLKLPDAIHVATAVVSGAEAFLTNDAGLARVELPIPVLRLDDLLEV